MMIIMNTVKKEEIPSDRVSGKLQVSPPPLPEKNNFSPENI